MKVEVELGTAGGAPAFVDLEELLATRLLVQGNSGSGKSHLLRRLLEQSARWVQQAVIDPEGDFVTLAERYGHVVVDAERSENELHHIARRLRQHRVSSVLNLENVDIDAQMRCAAAFLGGLFDAERDHWFPMLVVVDEAQLFAPAAAGEVSDEARKLSLGAMTNLMSRGRKRGLAGVVATQRLAKLAKNVAAEASNFLMGRTFLDIDMLRAADLLGVERRQAEAFRDLERGSFMALGPALSRRPLTVRIGPVETAARSTSPKLIPLPDAPEAEVEDLIFAPVEPARPSFAPRAVAPVRDVLREVEAVATRAAEREAEEAEAVDPAERERAIEAILASMLEEPDAAYHSVAVLFQDFVVRCRIQKIAGEAMSLPEFRRRLAVARAGVPVQAPQGSDWQAAVALAGHLTDDLQGMFLLLARAAMDGAPCPGDMALARACGSRSPGRARRLLAYMEERGFVALRTDRRGNRAISVPDLNCETAFGRPDAPDDAPEGTPSEAPDLFASIG